MESWVKMVAMRVSDEKCCEVKIVRLELDDERFERRFRLDFIDFLQTWGQLIPYTTSTASDKTCDLLFQSDFSHCLLIVWVVTLKDPFSSSLIK